METENTKKKKKARRMNERSRNYQKKVRSPKRKLNAAAVGQTGGEKRKEASESGRETLLGHVRWRQVIGGDR